MLTSAWYDKWCAQGPLSSYLTVRDISREGFSALNSFNVVFSNDNWCWPARWLDKAPVIAEINIPPISDEHDSVLWFNSDDTSNAFAVRQVWQDIRPKSQQVRWYDMVWFSHCIPKHAFLLWLLMREKMKTQDKLRPWEIRDDSLLVCPLCKLVPDSQDHLFFTCMFSHKVWDMVKVHMDFPIFTDGWKDFSELVIPFASRKIARIIIIKLLFGASIYFIWQERNNRLFKKTSRSNDQIYKLIYGTVRLKLMSFKWKNSTKVLRMKEDWKIP
ncbi:uncharacterized protein [Rutidosis leptorrhynchoides]|uniref:uncharacterized protein n=1 Tax=Rutidosis leptorrhynchoides TaxID=125765 RepID=UPI003A98D2C4